MACNCKKRNAVLKEGMEKKEETLLTKVSRKVGLSFTFLMVALVSLLTLPFVAVYTLCSVAVSGGVRVPIDEIVKRLA